MFDGEDYSSGLVRYLDEHVNMGMSDRAIDRLAANVREALKTPMGPNQFSRRIRKTEINLEAYDDDTTITLYVRDLLNNSPDGHKTKSIIPGYQGQAILRGGTSTILYIVSILKELEILSMMEESFERHPCSILGRMTKRTKIGAIKKAVMRRPVLLIPGYQHDEDLRKWERTEGQAKFYEETRGLLPKEIERERYEKMIKEAREALRANQ